MLIDEAEITLIGGKGGDGNVSFFPFKHGPSGGDGGKGGDIYIKVNPQMSSLHKYREKNVYEAGVGKPGASFRKQGEDGEDLVLQFPPGTEFTDKNTGQVIELNKNDAPVLIARGGRGGRGNDAFKSSTNQTPRNAEKGFDGEVRRFKIVMKLIADYGLIGLPNAGKSSLLNELTAANVKTANYAFTTLEPNLGALNGVIIADIPGLIEGASTGKGLGIKFLKHIEKVKMLLHCIAVDSADIQKEYETVMQELEAYNPKLVEKAEIILLTKIDLVNQDELKEKMKLLEKYGKKILPISIHDWDALQELKRILI